MYLIPQLYVYITFAFGIMRNTNFGKGHPDKGKFIYPTPTVVGHKNIIILCYYNLSILIVCNKPNTWIMSVTNY